MTAGLCDTRAAKGYARRTGFHLQFHRLLTRRTVALQAIPEAIRRAAQRPGLGQRAGCAELLGQNGTPVAAVAQVEIGPPRVGPARVVAGRADEQIGETVAVYIPGRGEGDAELILGGLTGGGENGGYARPRSAPREEIDPARAVAPGIVQMRADEQIGETVAIHIPRAGHSITESVARSRAVAHHNARRV